MYQKLIIMGNLGGDPEMRYTPTARRSPISRWPPTGSGTTRTAAKVKKPSGSG